VRVWRSDVIDALQVPSTTIKQTLDLGPYSTSRPQIAEEFAKIGDQTGVVHQFDQLDQVVKSQRLLVADPRLIGSWHAQRDRLIRQCRSHSQVR
jgi:hypothetical protein